MAQKLEGKWGQFLIFGILSCIIWKYFLHIFYLLNYSALPENGMQKTLKALNWTLLQKTKF